MISRLLIALTFLLSTSTALADIWPDGLMLPYVVLSDSVDETVPDGMCKIEGYVHYNGSKLNNVLVSTLDKENYAYTQDDGYYQITIPDGDTTIFAYKQGVDEVIIWHYEFKSKHSVRIDFYFQSNMVITAKPVIYMYSEEDLTATVSIDPKASLTFTYPAYNDKWSVDIKGNQMQVDEKEYPYLFWEGDSYNYEFLSNESTIEGYILHKDVVVSTLQDILTSYGLNNKERTDFITFWGPQMQDEDYYLVQFLVDDIYDKEVSKMLINPQPESIKRIYMLCSPIDQENFHYNVVSPEIRPFERKGFTVVEWGGSIIEHSKLYP